MIVNAIGSVLRKNYIANIETTAGLARKKQSFVPFVLSCRLRRVKFDRLVEGKRKKRIESEEGFGHCKEEREKEENRLECFHHARRSITGDTTETKLVIVDGKKKQKKQQKKNRK